MTYIHIGTTAEVSSNDLERIRDCWERIDACADRDEEFTATTWETWQRDVSLTVDSNGDIWHDGLFIASRDGDYMVVCGSLERIRVL